MTFKDTQDVIQREAGCPFRENQAVISFIDKQGVISFIDEQDLF